MFIKTTTHNRIVAEKDAEIAGLMRRIMAMRKRTEMDIVIINGLSARLAPFTKIRNRDSRGRFISG